MWEHHLGSLFRHSWANLLAALSSSTLSIVVFTVIAPVLIFILAVFYQWIRLPKDRRNVVAVLRAEASPAVILAVVTTVVVWAVLFGWSMANTVYTDHQYLVSENGQLASRMHTLEDTLQTKANTLDTKDPVTVNLIYMMQAFRSYRGMLGGFNKISCQVRLTAPQDSGPIASEIAQFSIQATNCTTFGPMDSNSDPDEKRDTIAGKPGKVIFHARRDDKAAFALYDNLASLIPLERSYDVPAGNPQNYVWLQFGPEVKWNSELVRQRAIP
jgi:hypothetical protein